MNIAIVRHGLVTPAIVQEWAKDAHLTLSEGQVMTLVRLTNYYKTMPVPWHGAAAARRQAVDLDERRSDVKALLRVMQRCYNRGDTAAGDAALAVFEAEIADCPDAIPTKGSNAGGRPPRLEMTVASNLNAALEFFGAGQKRGRDYFVKLAMAHLGVERTDDTTARGRRRRTKPPTSSVR